MTGSNGIEAFKIEFDTAQALLDAAGAQTGGTLVDRLRDFAAAAVMEKRKHIDTRKMLLGAAGFGSKAALAASPELAAIVADNEPIDENGPTYRTLPAGLGVGLDPVSFKKRYQVDGFDEARAADVDVDPPTYAELRDRVAHLEMLIRYGSKRAIREERELMVDRA